MCYPETVDREDFKLVIGRVDNIQAITRGGHGQRTDLAALEGGKRAVCCRLQQCKQEYQEASAWPGAAENAERDA